MELDGGDVQEYKLDKLNEFEGKKKVNIKLHFLITCFAYMFLGFGAALQQFGIKAGIPFEIVIIISPLSILSFGVVVFTSMQKVKEILYKTETPK